MQSIILCIIKIYHITIKLPLFLVKHTLGISQEAAQILIIFGFIVMMVLILRYIVNYLRANHGLNREYLETPIIQNTRNHYWNEEERRWERR